MRARVASLLGMVRARDRHGYNRKVHRITKRQLMRAVNALSDLITSLS